MEILDFGNQYFYDLGLNRKLCKGIHRLDELYATASDHSHKWAVHDLIIWSSILYIFRDQVTELFKLWAEDDCSEEQYGAVLFKLSSESMNDTKFKDEFSEVYGELIKFAGFESFDEEHFNITGAVFRWFRGIQTSANNNEGIWWVEASESSQKTTLTWSSRALRNGRSIQPFSLLELSRQQSATDSLCHRRTRVVSSASYLPSLEFRTLPTWLLSSRNPSIMVLTGWKKGLASW